ncbi:MAG: beta-ketoacyl synthase [Flavobacteriaceae bacterium]|jgi:3-oxoacyl-[acyl-carrier-protein] synthase I|nr:beta-ketoacyl synthase [Flavobacteriaceae bacterium]
MREAYITHHNIISSLGFTSEANFDQLIQAKSGIKKYQRENNEVYFSSKVDKEKLNSEFKKIGDTESYTTLEKMMILSVNSILSSSNYKITKRTGLIIATTKGNIDTLSPSSKFYKDPKRSYLYELGNQINYFFDFKNEAIVLSNACVSGVLAVSVAQRFINDGVYEEVIIVSGDLVSEFILSGFTSFQAISNEPCKPYSTKRKGITIGEAVASVLVTSKKKKNAIQVLGTGSCNDANHISGPSRTGEGLVMSVRSALNEAKIKTHEIDYISAHGTATNFNDEMEAVAFSRLKMLETPINSLKGFYGHTLGASGLLESIIGIKSLEKNTLIGSLGFDELGVSECINVIKKTEKKELNIFLKTASGFGGCNTAVIFKKSID